MNGLSDSTANHSVEEDFEFDCPECGVHIKGEVDHCPKCGVEFVIEEVADVECPACHSMVPGESTACPMCGRSFVSKEEVRMEEVKAPPFEESPVPQPSVPGNEELREEFSDLVNEVRPMLLLAKEFSINTSNARRQIDKAVGLGKRREVDAAVKTLRECRELLVRSISDRLERDIMDLENLTEIARKMSSDHNAIQKIIESAQEKKAAGDLEGALAEARSGRRLAEQLTGKYAEAHELYEALERLILNAEMFYLDVREARKLLNEARDAGEAGDWTTMGILSKKGREDLNRVLPEVLMLELRNAKQSLLDAKASGRDVTAMVKILKDAGVSMKRDRYEDALERLTEFRAEAKNV